MFYDFQCSKCGKCIERQFRMADVPRTVECSCGSTAKRVYNGFALDMNGGLNRTSGFGESIKKKNDEAAKRMRGNAPPVKTIAYDYGGGDIRGV